MRRAHFDAALTFTGSACLTLAVLDLADAVIRGLMFAH